MGENGSKRVPKGEVKFAISLSQEQKEAKHHILNTPFNFVLGEAGTGKTLLAIQIALDLYFNRKIEKIVITRPTVSSENIGFIPGSIEEKMEPWMIPILDNLHKVCNKTAVLEKMITDGRIEVVSLMHFRGRTFENSLCIVDEFQNLTHDQLSMCIGRVGRGSSIIFSGDKGQIDLCYKENSAVHSVKLLKESNFVYICELVENHRHPGVREVLKLLYSQK